jgi:zinc and cadmium transporter
MMNSTWTYSLLSILLVSLAAFSGIIFFVLKFKIFKKLQTLLISFSIGTMLGGAFLHLIPESLEQPHSTLAPLMVIVSIVAFFVLEKYLHILRHNHPHENEIKSFGPLNLLADGMHNFLDGILIAASYKIDINTGIIATAVVFAHELPQEIGDFAVLIQAGYSKKKALFFNFVSALSAFAGGILVLAFPGISEDFSQDILPLAAGGFIYIALADLVPEINIKQSILMSVFQVITLISGVVIMYLLRDLNFMHH